MSKPPSLKDLRIYFEVTREKKANLLIRLKHDGFKVYEFFRLIIDAYIDQDERIVDLVQDFLEEKKRINNLEAQQRRLIRKKKEKNKKMYGLTDEDISNIFDVELNEENTIV